MHTAVKKLQEQLDQAETHITSMDPQFHAKEKEPMKSPAVPSTPTVVWRYGLSAYCETLFRENTACQGGPFSCFAYLKITTCNFQLLLN